MRVLEVGPIAVPFILTLALGVGHTNRAQAQAPATFVIAEATGYGVEDCLGEGGECGKVVADAWCEAHGRGLALQFGRRDSVAGAGESPLFVTCGD